MMSIRRPRSAISLKFPSITLLRLQVKCCLRRHAFGGSWIPASISGRIAGGTFSTTLGRNSVRRKLRLVTFCYAPLCFVMFGYVVLCLIHLLLMVCAARFLTRPFLAPLLLAAEKDVLVITAGLLMRLVKLGVYSLDQTTLLVLHDAFYTTRNHPMNTLVREYYWKIPAEGRPKILGTLLPQLHALSRPFDKLRQSVRKLAHSLQAGIALPAGHALETLAARVHRSRLVFQPYETFPEEKDLIMTIMRHFLAMWDVLFKFNLNPFGRLIHFPKTDEDVLGAF